MTIEEFKHSPCSHNNFYISTLHQIHFVTFISNCTKSYPNHLTLYMWTNTQVRHDRPVHSRFVQWGIYEIDN